MTQFKLETDKMAAIPLEEIYLKQLQGEVVTRVFVDQWACGFITENDAFLRLDGRWNLFDSEGKSIDSDLVLGERKEFSLWRVCGTKLLDVKLIPEPADSLSFAFDNGLRLIAYTSDSGYTDWDLRTPTFGLFSYGGELHFTDFSPLRQKSE